jgi:hypothetical protein
LSLGLLPGLRASRPNARASSDPAGTLLNPRATPHRTGAVLVVSQIALALMLLIGALLLIRTSINIHNVDPGFDTRNVLTMRMSVSGTPFATRAGIERLTQGGIARIRAIPGVASASTTCCMPLETVWQLPFEM